MRKIILSFLVFIVLSFCIFYLLKGKETSDNVVINEEGVIETKAIFISYIDYSSKLKGKSVEIKKEVIDNMVDNVSNSKLNTIILQVRPFADAIYKSIYFKPSTTVYESEDSEIDLDVLEYFIKKSHDKKIKLYAWINPYRIRSTNDKSTISKSSYFNNFFNSTKIYESEQGIYFNPASKEVLDLIINGIKEIVSNYDIDGILYDDYFYPNKEIDKKEYDEYVSKNGNITIEEYRINNINNLIKSTYDEIKNIKPGVLFGVSPSGNNINNLNEEYLDVSFLLRNDKYLDFIMPQLYYGFLNSSKPFKSTLDEFDNLINNGIGLIPALALYKSGTYDKYALDGVNEWVDNTDIIRKQIVVSRSSKNYKGFSIYRYDYLFDLEKLNENLEKEIVNFLQVI